MLIEPIINVARLSYVKRAVFTTAQNINEIAIQALSSMSRWLNEP
jgi:hypothetical protein